MLHPRVDPMTWRKPSLKLIEMKIEYCIPYYYYVLYLSMLMLICYLNHVDTLHYKLILDKNDFKISNKTPEKNLLHLNIGIIFNFRRDVR